MRVYKRNKAKQKPVDHHLLSLLRIPLRLGLAHSDGLRINTVASSAVFMLLRCCAAAVGFAIPNGAKVGRVSHGNLCRKGTERSNENMSDSSRSRMENIIEYKTWGTQDQGKKRLKRNEENTQRPQLERATTSMNDAKHYLTIGEALRVARKELVCILNRAGRKHVRLKVRGR